MIATTAQLIAAKQRSTQNPLWKDALLTLVILVAILLFSQLLGLANNSNVYQLFGLALSIVAVIELGGRTFSEFKQSQSAAQWLILPASTFEKWLANFIHSALIIPIGFITLLGVASLLSQIFAAALQLSPLPMFNPLSQAGLSLFIAYLWWHPIMFFAAIYFKKRPLLKMTGLLCLLGLVFMIYIVIIFQYLPDPASAGINIRGGTQFYGFAHEGGVFSYSLGLGELAQETGLLAVLTFLKWAYFPFFWAMSFLRLKELEL